MYPENGARMRALSRPVWAILRNARAPSTFARARTTWLRWVSTWLTAAARGVLPGVARRRRGPAGGCGEPGRDPAEPGGPRAGERGRGPCVPQDRPDRPRQRPHPRAVLRVR